MRRLFVFFAIILLALGAAQIFIYLHSQKKIANKPVEITQEASSTAVLDTQNPEETAIVSRVIDGDTVVLSDGRRLRYIGIDTPEIVAPGKPVECYGYEAKEENKRLVDGKTVRLGKDVSQTDTYGRILRYVYAGDVFVNEYLVRQGFAHASSYPPDDRYSEQFSQAQSQAMLQNKGLWGGCKK